VSHRPDVVAALASAARTINQPQSVATTLEAIVHAARDSVLGFDHVGVSLVHPDGRVETRAATGPLVRELDELQYELREGPCVSTLRGEPVIVAERIRHSDRWPRYVPRALAAGLRAQMALRLYIDDRGTIGGLNLYSVGDEGIDEHAPQVAEVFAAQAAVALGQAHRVEHLHAALESRQVVARAVGIVIERYQVDEDTAFTFLARVSSQTETKMRDLAAQVVADAVAGGDRRPERET
jgi:GAF domain-containing protein